MGSACSTNVGPTDTSQPAQRGINKYKVLDKMALVSREDI